MKTITINNPVFKSEVLFVLGCNHETFVGLMLKDYNWKISHESGIDGTMLTLEDDDGIFRVIWCKGWNKNPTPYQIGVLSHEILHLVTRIHEDKLGTIYCHLKDGTCGDETAAYMMNFYLQKVLEESNLLNKKNKR